MNRFKAQSYRSRPLAARSLAALLISVMVTVVVFAYVFSQITWQQVFLLIRNLDWHWAGLFVALSMGQHVIRTWRYRLLLRTAGERIRFGALFLVVLVRAFCVDLLPARMGELVYIYLLKKRFGTSFGAASTSFGLAFLFDIMVIGPLILIAVLGVKAHILPDGIMLAAGGMLFLGAVLTVALLPLGLRLAFRIIPAQWSRLRRLVASVHQQVGRAQSAGVYGKVFALSVCVRLLKYGSMYVLLVALLRPSGMTSAGFPLPVAFLGFCAAEIAASLPASGIAGFGAYEGVWTLVFQWLGYPQDVASLTAVSHHLLTQAYGYTLGLIALAGLLAFRFRGKASKGPDVKGMNDPW